MEYEDNQHVLDLITKRPTCVLGMLDEGCQMASSTDSSVLLSFHSTFKDPKKHKAYTKPLKSQDKTFVITHYAGAVIYTITGFVEKNKDEVTGPSTTAPLRLRCQRASTPARTPPCASKPHHACPRPLPADRLPHHRPRALC